MKQRKLGYSSLIFLVGCLSPCTAAFGTVSFTARETKRLCGTSTTKLNLLPPEATGTTDLLFIVAPSSFTLIGEAATANQQLDTGLLSNQAIVATFVIGLVPFAVATVEFWRRIAVGDSFGTGNDSVVIIGEDDAPLSSRGRRVLGKGALVTAYILFGVAAAVLAIVLYAVLSSSPPDNIAVESLPSSLST